MLYMASNFNYNDFHNLHCSNEPIQNSEKGCKGEDLIDLDKVLPIKTDSNWLIECNGNSAELEDSFSKLHFKNPVIKDIVKSVYQSGKSKQVLHQLLYLNEKMTMSCDNWAYFYKNGDPKILVNLPEFSNKRHSIGVINNDLNYAIDTFTYCNDNSLKSIDFNCNDVTISKDNLAFTTNNTSIKEFRVPIISDKPFIKSSVESDNILSRTYDKKELETLKQAQLSQSVFVPRIGDSAILSNPQIHLRTNVKTKSVNQVDFSRHTFGKDAIDSFSHRSYKKPLLPIGSTSIGSSTATLKQRPISSYQVDKLFKNTSDVKDNQIPPKNLNTKKLFQVNQTVFDTEVVTPINSLRNTKSNSGIGLRRSNTCRK